MQDVTQNRWEERWSTNNIGWDQGGSHPALVRLLSDSFLEAEKVGIPKTGKAVVPGSGMGYDVLALAQRGLDTIGVDISPTGAEAARKWLAGQPKSNASTEIVLADFFAWDPKDRFDVILDYTFLCALPPTLRPTWSTHITHLANSSSPSTRLITIMYPLPHATRPPKAGGPPFELSIQQYHDLLDEHWEQVWMEEVEESEMRKSGAQGGEAIAVWKLRSSTDNQ